MDGQTAVSKSFTRQRAEMVAHLQERGIVQTAVLQAIGRIPRELFVPPPWQEFTYSDQPLPIPCGQTISQVFVIAYMIQALAVKPGQRVLEIGAGSGYATAVLSQIAAEVYGVERLAELVAYARERLATLGIRNVQLRHANGTLGWPEAAPFDAILVSAGGPRIPKALPAQLAAGGRLIMPVGVTRHYQDLRLVQRRSETDFLEEDLAPVAFVPLIGVNGWGVEKA